MRRLGIFFTSIAATAVAVMVLAAPAFADGGGTVEGKVVNGTANGSSVGDVEVTLTAYFGQTERNKSTTKTDASGGFKFTGLETNSSYSYEAATTYQKADYEAPRVSFSGAAETKSVTLKVYDASTDPGTVKTTAKHYQLSFGNGGEVQVSEILVMRNDTDKTFVGSREVGPDQRETSKYMPPSGAKNIEYGDTLMSCCVVKDGAGFVDTMAITPGEVQKIYSYRLPYSGTALSFISTLQQNVDKVQVLVPNGSVRANVAGLANHGAQTLQGTDYQVFSADNLKANTNLDVTLEGLPVASPLGEVPLALIAIALGVLAALAVAFYVLRKRSQPGVPQPANSIPYNSPYAYYAAPKKERRAASNNPALLELERRDLLSAIANLDEAFEAGQIGRQDYERLRAEKKRRLMQLMQPNGGKKSTVRI